jgi:hypothetical protein
LKPPQTSPTPANKTLQPTTGRLEIDFLGINPPVVEVRIIIIHSKNLQVKYSTGPHHHQEICMTLSNRNTKKTDTQKQKRQSLQLFPELHNICNFSAKLEAYDVKLITLSNS